MELRRLRLLRELRDRGTIGAVAEALGYSPSAVSQQLRVLETETGAALLERRGRRVRLTESGVALARVADKLLATVEEAEAELAVLAKSVSGTVRVAAFQTATLALVPPAFTALADAYPDLRPELHEFEPEAALQGLAQHRVDLVIADEWSYVPQPTLDGLLREDLLREPVRLVLAAAHPLATPGEAVSLKQLARAPWATAHAQSAESRMLTAACRELGGFTPDVRHRCTDLLIQLALVRIGHAVALTPDLVPTEDDPTLAVRDIAEGSLYRTIFLAVRAPAVERPALAAVRQALKDAAAGRSVAVIPESRRGDSNP